MEKAKTRKIKKWDEVHGEYETEVSEDMGGSSPEEAAGAGPSISRNPMRGIEDMVEQNDNSFDAVINNVKAEPVAGTPEIVPDDKKSVLEKLRGRADRYRFRCLSRRESRYRDAVLRGRLPDGREIKTN